MILSLSLIIHPIESYNLFSNYIYLRVTAFAWIGCHRAQSVCLSVPCIAVHHAVRTTSRSKKSAQLSQWWGLCAGEMKFNSVQTIEKMSEQKKKKKEKNFLHRNKRFQTDANENAWQQMNERNNKKRIEEMKKRKKILFPFARILSVYFLSSAIRNAGKKESDKEWKKRKIQDIKTSTTDFHFDQKLNIIKF